MTANEVTAPWDDLMKVIRERRWIESLAGLPAEEIREKALARGYDPGDLDQIEYLAELEPIDP